MYECEGNNKLHERLTIVAPSVEHIYSRYDSIPGTKKSYAFLLIPNSGGVWYRRYVSFSCDACRSLDFFNWSNIDLCTQLICQKLSSPCKKENWHFLQEVKKVIKNKINLDHLEIFFFGQKKVLTKKNRHFSIILQFFFVSYSSSEFSEKTNTEFVCCRAWNFIRESPAKMNLQIGLHIS